MIQNTIYSSSHICLTQVAFFKYFFCGPIARTGGARLTDTLHLTVIHSDNVRSACNLMYEDQLLHDVGSKTKACGQFTTRSAKVPAVMRNWILSIFGNNYIKKVLFLTILVCSAIVKGFSQKYDKNWVIGMGGRLNKPYNKGFILNFEDSGTIKFNGTPLKMVMFGTNTSMSDEEGNLQFYSNGGIVNNYMHERMENGNDIIVPNIWYDPSDEIYTTFDQNNCIPDNRLKGVYYLVQNYFDTVYLPPTSESDTFQGSTKLLMTKIDMNQNNGLGKVIYKKKLAYGKQNFYSNDMIKHGNGRYWWAILEHVNAKDYTALLLDNDSIMLEKRSSVAYNKKSGHSSGDAPKAKSLDGSLYLDLRGRDNEIRIFNFDRCSGELTMKKRLELKDEPKWGKNWNWNSTGIAISPNNRFVYLNRSIDNANTANDEYLYVCQIDLEDTDPWKNRIILLDSFYSVEFEDGTKTKAAPWNMGYGLDGRIYFVNNAGDGAKSPLYVIQNPNEKGKACSLCDTCIYFPYSTGAGIPKYANYRLGPLKGSPCDTLKVATKDLDPNQYRLKMLPNPAADKLQLDITLPEYDPGTKTDIVILDVAGEVVIKYPMPDFAYLANVDISALTSGVYAVQLKQRNQVMAVEKLVVVR